MYGSATESNRRRGSALVSSLVVTIGLVGLVYVAVSFSSNEVEDARGSMDELRVRYVADAGLEWGLNFLETASARANVYDPLDGIQDVFGGQATLLAAAGDQIVSGDGAVGEYVVSMEIAQVGATSMTIDVTATGYLPAAPANLPPGQALKAWDAVTATVEYELAPSPVFNYAYFINNWGWFYGNTIFCNGNARSNGQFDAAGFRPTVTGQPMYSSVTKSGGTVDLIGYQDDNQDGLADGNDGGIWSGWDVVGAQNVKGNGGKKSNQHDFAGAIEMPNLSNLEMYETQALAEGGSIKIGGIEMANAVYGDEVGESGHLYLEGTAANPIVLDGPVVIRGDVIIKGVVTGQGAIYSGRNVYVPESITYLDGPSSARPASNSETDTEAWMAANWDKDFLGLFAAENVAVGDFTNPTWRTYVGGWMGHHLNKSEEDAGEDGIPNTKAGRDGILGTADDDVLEDDGVFTVEYYTAEDQAKGLIPPGSSVGDVIPGTGEDIDGDGKYDDTTTLADIDFASELDSGDWGGNLPPGTTKYSSVASLYANNLDAVFFTNHTFAWTVLGASPARVNGAIVSRNESIVYGTPSVDINYDARLLGGASGMAGGLLPRRLLPPEILVWRRLDEDPNRQLAAAAAVAP